MPARRDRRSAAPVLAVVCLLAACAAKQRTASFPMAAAPAEAAPAPLERSLFARDPGGQLTEDALQTILNAPIELDLPARVGVLPIITAADWRGPSPDFKQVPAGTGELAKALRGAEPFTLVTEIMPIPSGALGMEALREVAARYRLRYVLLYREMIRPRTRLNAWAWTYPTVLGALVMPGQTLEVGGYVEASLFDVKTGTFLFTVRRGVRAVRTANVWHREYKLERMQVSLAMKYAPDLAADVRAAVARTADAVQVENQRRLAVRAPSPDAVTTSPAIAAPAPR